MRNNTASTPHDNVKVLTATGNERQGRMSSSEEKQCILDIKSWYSDHTDLRLVGASTDKIKKLRKLIGSTSSFPQLLESLLKEMNGKIWIYEQQLLSVSEIIEAFETTGSSYFPVSRDLDDDYLCIRLKDGSLVSFSESDGPAKDEDAPSLSDWLEKFRNSLMAGRLEYVEDCGFTEVEKGPIQAASSK
eukprot:g1270.t1